MYNAVLVSGAQQSDPFTRAYMFFFQILFSYRLLQNIEYSSIGVYSLTVLCSRKAFACLLLS